MLCILVSIIKSTFFIVSTSGSHRKMKKKVCWSAIQMENNNPDISKSGMNLRPSTTREWNEDGFTKAAKESFFRNAAKIWN